MAHVRFCGALLHLTYFIQFHLVRGAVFSEYRFGSHSALRGGFSYTEHSNEALEPAIDPDENVVREAQAQATAETETVISRLEKLRHTPRFVREEAAHDMGLIKENLLPGLEFKVATQAWNISTLIICMCILHLYLRFFYQVDHDFGWDKCSHEELFACAKNEGHSFEKRVKEHRDTMLWGLLSPEKFCWYRHLPDLVLVFENPGFTEKEGTNKGEMSAGKLKSILSQDVKKRDTFPRIWRMLVQRGAVQEGDDTFSPRTLDLPLDKAELTKALLQDIYEDLPKRGFDSDLFRSVDDRYLFVCITLAQSAWIDLYMRREGWALPLQQRIVNELGMGACTDPDAMSPPYVKYDSRTVTHLYECDIIDEEDPRQVYLTHHGDGRPDYCIGRTDRLRIVLKEMQGNVSFGAAKLHGLLVEWYPVHSMHQLHRFGLVWAKPQKILDLSFVQPICKIETYFGPRLAFTFAWHGLYCKMLLPLAICGLVWWAGAMTLELGWGVENAKRQILGFMLVVLIWSRIASNLWDREQEYFMKLFNLDTGSVVPTVRPEFRGVQIPSPADSFVEETVAPPLMNSARRILSKSITVCAIMLVAGCINLWFSVFEGRFNILAGLFLTVQIQIFQWLYNHLSLMLNNLENHKFSNDYYDSLLWKRFAFGFVNSYWAFFYIAVKQRFTEQGCQAEGCFIDLRNQLRMTLIILVVSQVVVTLAQVAYVQLCLKWEDDKVQKDKGSKLKKAWIEAQFQYIEFGTVEQIAMMQQLALTLGYVILFGGVAPAIIPFCLLAFAATLRSAAFLLVTSSKQVLPENSLGIGAWRDVVAILMDVGVLFSGFLLAVFSETFADAELIAKMTGIICYCLAVFLLWRVTDIFCPPTSETVKILDVRRTRSKELLMDVAVDYPGGGRTPHSGKHMDPWERRQSIQRHGTDNLFKEAVGDDDRAVAEGDWFSIPHVRTEDPSHFKQRTPRKHHTNGDEDSSTITRGDEESRTTSGLPDVK